MHPLVVAAVALVFAGSACSQQAEPAATKTAVEVTKAAALIPLPAATGKVVLTLTGLTAEPTKRAIIALDQASLDAMSNVEDTIYEPFVKKDIRFRGVALSDLMARAGVTSGKVFMHALDDYTYNTTVAELVAGRALLATRAGGQPIPLADGGPIRIVFQAESGLGKKTDAWVWSIDSIRLTSG